MILINKTTKRYINALRVKFYFKYSLIIKKIYRILQASYYTTLLDCISSRVTLRVTNTCTTFRQGFLLRTLLLALPSSLIIRNHF